MFLWISWAFAQTTVLDPTRVEQLGPATFVDGAWGWSAPVLDEAGARVRAWPTESESAAQAVFVERPGGAAEAWPGVDAARGDGWTHLVVRVDELVLEVTRPAGGAFDLAMRLVKQVERQPRLSLGDPVVDGSQLRLEGACARVSGRITAFDLDSPLATGALVPSIGRCELTLPPAACGASLLAWDRFGRGEAVTWTSAAVGCAEDVEAAPAPGFSRPELPSFSRPGSAP